MDQPAALSACWAICIWNGVGGVRWAHSAESLLVTCPSNLRAADRWLSSLRTLDGYMPDSALVWLLKRRRLVGYRGSRERSAALTVPCVRYGDSRTETVGIPDFLPAGLQLAWIWASVRRAPSAAVLVRSERRLGSDLSAERHMRGANTVSGDSRDADAIWRRI